MKKETTQEALETGIIFVHKLIILPKIVSTWSRENHFEQNFSEFFIFVAVDDKVNGGVDCRQEVRKADHCLHPLIPCTLHIHP